MMEWRTSLCTTQASPALYVSLVKLHFPYSAACVEIVLNHALDKLLRLIIRFSFSSTTGWDSCGVIAGVWGLELVIAGEGSGMWGLESCGVVRTWWGWWSVCWWGWNVGLPFWICPSAFHDPWSYEPFFAFFHYCDLQGASVKLTLLTSNKGGAGYWAFVVCDCYGLCNN